MEIGKNNYMLNVGFSYDELLQKYYDENGVFLTNITIHTKIAFSKENNLLKLGFIKISKQTLQNIVQLQDDLLEKDFLWIRKKDFYALQLLAAKQHELIIKSPNLKWICTTVIYSVYSKNYTDIIKQKQKKLK